MFPILSKYLIFFLVSVSFCAVATKADEVRGIVVKVSDGDSLVVIDRDSQPFKIRLVGIDAPEASQRFGEESKKSLSDLTYGNEITVVWTKTDKYGRILGKVFVAGIDVNLEQINRGLAWLYLTSGAGLSRQDRVIYNDAEKKAKNNQFGLWMDKNPITPWEFRRSKAVRYKTTG